MKVQKLYEEGIEGSEAAYVLFENLVILAMMTLGFLGMYPVRIKNVPVVSIVYVLFSLLMLGFVLRKHLCSGCYYYGKRCHCGWGKLASAVCREDSGNNELGGKLALLTWGVVMGLPVIVMILIVILDKATLMGELYFFVPFVVLVIINSILHVVDCKKCKMRYVCPGSAAKDK